MKASRRVHLVECPRDAIQGWPHPIATEDKLAYYRVLLRVGFDTLDLGSFVSPKAIPAMADTGKVLDQLEAEGIWDQVSTRALVIVANERGARDAVEYDSVSAVGFPLSLSPTFQERNTRASVDEAWKRLDVVANHCANRGKDLVVYLSMGFGNPYGDAWSEEMPTVWAKNLVDRLSPSVIPWRTRSAPPHHSSSSGCSPLPRKNWGRTCWGHICTCTRWMAWKKSKQLTEVAAFALMGHCGALEAARWPKMIWLEMLQPRSLSSGRRQRVCGP